MKNLLLGNWVARLAWLMMLSWPMVGSLCDCYFGSCIYENTTSTRFEILYNYSKHSALDVYKLWDKTNELKYWHRFEAKINGINITYTQSKDSVRSDFEFLSAPYIWKWGFWFLGENADSSYVDMIVLDSRDSGKFMRLHDLNVNLNYEKYIQIYPVATIEDFNNCRLNKIISNGRELILRQNGEGYDLVSYYMGGKVPWDTLIKGDSYVCHFRIDKNNNISSFYPNYIDSVVLNGDVYVTRKGADSLGMFDLFKNGIVVSKIKDPLIYGGLFFVSDSSFWGLKK